MSNLIYRGNRINPEMVGDIRTKVNASGREILPGMTVSNIGDTITDVDYGDGAEYTGCVAVEGGVHQGMGVNDAYADGQPINYVVPKSGDILQVIVSSASGDPILKGTHLVAADSGLGPGNAGKFTKKTVVGFGNITNTVICEEDLGVVTEDTLATVTVI